MKDFSVTFIIFIFVSLTVSQVCYASPETTEITYDSVVIESGGNQYEDMIASDEPFNMDEYYEELAKQYGGKDYERIQKLQKRFEGDMQLRQELEMKRKRIRWFVIIVSLLVALIPTFAILRKVTKGEIKPAGTGAVLRTVGILLLWGVLLFILNYFWLWTSLTGNTKVMGVVLGLLLYAFVIYAVHSINKYNKKLNDNNPEKQ